MVSVKHVDSQLTAEIQPILVLVINTVIDEYLVPHLTLSFRLI